MSSSWKLESSQTIQASAGASTPGRARPTFPATAADRRRRGTSRRATRRGRLPVRPGDAEDRVRRAAGNRARPRSRSGSALRARRARCRGDAWALDEDVGAVEERESSSLRARARRRTTSTPCRSSSAAAASPERSSPRTTARFMNAARVRAPTRPRRRPRGRPTRRERSTATSPISRRPAGRGLARALEPDAA